MKKTLFLILLSLFIFRGYSQELPDINNDKLLQKVGEKYLGKANGLMTIYSGKEQIKYLLTIIGHPYLNSAVYENGFLSYEGILYPDVRLRLDLYLNELIIQSPDSRFNIILDSDKIDYANLYDYKIIYHNKNKSSIPLNSGYYIQLPTNKYKIWRQSNAILKETVTDKVTQEFIHKDKYYFFKDGHPHLIKGSGSVLRLFPSRKKELKQYIKQNGYSFRNNPEEFLLKISQQIEILE